MADRLVSRSQRTTPIAKCAFNSWLRSAGSAFDASPALLFIGFAVPAVREGVASL